MNTIKEDFRRLLDNNKDEDWNDSTFRKTMVDAFRFNVNKRINWLKENLDDEQDKELVNEAFPEDKK